MLKPVYTRQFERDLKKIRKRGKNLDKVKDSGRESRITGSGFQVSGSGFRVSGPGF